MAMNVQSVDNYTDDEPPLKQPRLEKHKLVPIITPLIDPKLFSKEVPLSSFYAVNLLNKKLIGTILKLVPDIPEAFSHLKRVDKQGRVLLQDANKCIDDNFLSTIKAVCGDQVSIELVSVPSLKPVTRQQFECAKTHWSTAYHPNDELELIVTDKFFSSEDIETISQRIVDLFDSCVVVQDGVELARGVRNDSLLGHPAMDMVGNLAILQRNDSEYLATGCDVYLDKEPCGMCAMALVHARASRIFFRERCSNGVLTSGKWQLHLEPCINHHYKAFHVQLDSTLCDSVLYRCGS